MYHGANSFRKGERTVKRLMLAVAAITLFLTTVALPSLADGNPMPICTKTGCTKPLPPSAPTQSWANFYSWVATNTLTQQCASDQSGNVWNCGFVTANGTQLLAVWDSSQTCNNSGFCTHSSYTVPTSPGYTRYYDLDGASFSLGSTVNIGCYPILLSQ
jgi:hypothetical protein